MNKSNAQSKIIPNEQIQDGGYKTTFPDALHDGYKPRQTTSENGPNPRDGVFKLSIGDETQLKDGPGAWDERMEHV